MLNLRNRAPALARMFAVASVVLLAAVRPTLASTVTTTFTLQIAIAATGTTGDVAAPDFATPGVLAAKGDQTSAIRVRCPGLSSRNIGLDAVTRAGATDYRHRDLT